MPSRTSLAHLSHVTYGFVREEIRSIRRYQEVWLGFVSVLFRMEDAGVSEVPTEPLGPNNLLPLLFLLDRIFPYFQYELLCRNLLLFCLLENICTSLLVMNWTTTTQKIPPNFFPSNTYSVHLFLSSVSLFLQLYCHFPASSVNIYNLCNIFLRMFSLSFLVSLPA